MSSRAGDLDPSLPKYYVTGDVSYPSGRLHMGHVRNYALGDVIGARFKRARGFNVLHPMHGSGTRFGLLRAENAADGARRSILAGLVSPRTSPPCAPSWKQLGLSIDWSREFATCDVEYYGKQRAGLVPRPVGPWPGRYRKEGVVNWDPVDMTVLANEQSGRWSRLAIGRGGPKNAS